jgi:hypothetical protein
MIIHTHTRVSGLVWYSDKVYNTGIDIGGKSYIEQKKQNSIAHESDDPRDPGPVFRIRKGYSRTTVGVRILWTCVWIRGSAHSMSFTGFDSSSNGVKAVGSLWTKESKHSPANTSLPCRFRILPS